MKRIRIVAIAATLLLAGCVSDYAYRGGSGDYYYSQPSVYGYYGAPYSSLGYGYPGGWYGSIGYSYGYGSPYRYPGYGYYGAYRPYPYYYYRPHRPHRPHRPERPEYTGPVTGGQRPAIMRPKPQPDQAPVHVRAPQRTAGPRPVLQAPGNREYAPQRVPSRGGQPLARPQSQAPERVQAPTRVRAERPMPRAERPAPRPSRDQEP